VKAENATDWAISSRADEKSPEGSTTRLSNLKPSAEILREMYAGMTTREIAKELGVSNKTASRWVGEVVKMRKPGQKVNGQKLRDTRWLKKEYATKSAEQIAKDLGCVPKTVVNALRSAGVEVRRTNIGLKFPDVGPKISEARKGRFLGDQNPNWRGDAVKKYRRERSSYAAKEWSRKVKERDEFRCVKCGTEGELHAHHVVSWRRSVDGRYDVGNGISLCIPCHQLEHANEFAAWVLVGKGKRSKSTEHPKG
jgi:predicted transcriptional regulator